MRTSCLTYRVPIALASNTCVQSTEALRGNVAAAYGAWRTAIVAACGSRRLVGAAARLFMLFGPWVTPATAVTNVYVHFIGPAATHVAYEVQWGDIREFRVQDPEGLWTVLDSSKDGEPLNGMMRHETPERGTYTYQTRYKDADDWINQAPKEALVEGNIANGTMFFDEFLMDAGIRGVTIGAGVSLTLDGLVFGADPLTNALGDLVVLSPREIIVREGGAALELTDGMMVTNVTIAFYQPFSFQGSAHAETKRNRTQLDRLMFYAGSGGSELANVDFNSISSWTDLTLGGFISGWPDFGSGSPHLFTLPAAVYAHGDLAFLWPTKIRPEVSIWLSQAGQYSGLEGGTFITLKEGTTFMTCKSLTVDPRKGVQLTGVTNSHINLSADLTNPGGPEENMTVTVLDSHVDMHAIARRGKYVLRDSTVSPPVIQQDADWDVERVEFMNTLYIGEATDDPTDTVFVGRFRAVDTRFKGFSAARTAPGAVSMFNGLFSGIVTVFGGAPSFNGCEFGARVNLVNRSSVSIQNSLFMQGLRFHNLATDSPFNQADTPPWYAPGAAPVINGNDFVGDVALIYHRQVGEDDEITAPINIGANYYGDAQGPLIDTESGFLGYVGGHGGGRVVSAIGSLPALASNVFALASWQTGPTTGRRQDTRVPPRFWLNGSIAGQGTLSHSSAAMGWDDPNRLKGRDTLLSLDLMTTDADLTGVRIYADWNGQRIYADGPQRLYRDRSRLSPAAIQAGRATADFVLPGVPDDSMTVRVFVDASESGYRDAPAELLLMSATLSFADTPARPLRIGVAPVWLIGYGEGSAGPVVEELRKELPAMLPLPSDRLEVVELSRITMPSLGGLFSSISTLNALSAKIAASRWISSKVSEQPLDFVAAVLPSGFIGKGIDGANFKLRRRVLFVDTSKPSAVVHELGHGMGLYTGTEQYDLHPELGLPISGETAFATEGKWGRGRHEHYAAPEYGWFKAHSMYDIMGNTDRGWPTRLTRDAFGEWIRAYLSEAPDAASVPEATRSSSADYTTRDATSRVLITGGVRLTAANADRYEFTPGTLAGFDVSGEAPPSAAPAAAGLWYHKHRLIAYNAQGDVIEQQDFYLTQDDGLWQGWTATFEIPLGTTAYAIHKIDNWGRSVGEILSVQSAGLVSNDLLRPAAGATIGAWFDAEWTYQAGAGHDPRHISHALYYRTGPAEPWTPFIAPTHESSMRHLSDSLPPTDSLELRLVTSDGLKAVETVRTGLTVEARAPRVVLVEPRPGEAGLAELEWPLRADVTDPDGTGLDEGTWTSSLDGILGLGPSLAVPLSPGDHTLVYTVQGHNGLTGSDSVQVAVFETMESTDLTLTEARLTLHNTLTDPTGIIPERVAPGGTNSLLLQFRNPGVDATGRVRVYLQRPEGAEEEIGDDRFALSPFETAVHLFRFTASGAGEYTVRVELSEVDPVDSAPENDTREWTFASLTPAIVLTPDVLQLYRSPSGQPGELFNTWEGIVRVENNGFTDLHVSSVTLHGAAAGQFTIVQNEASGGPIASLGAAAITLRAAVPYGSVRHAVLRVASDDPDRPVAEALLLAIVGDAAQLEDSDDDGLMDGIERYLGYNPEQADSDGNGTNDLAELRASFPLDGAIIRLSGSLDFGAVAIGSNAESVLRILNLGTAPLAITAIGYPDGFSGPLLLADPLPGGGATNLIVAFAPLAVQDYSGAILVTSDARSGDSERLASGSGVLPTVVRPAFDPDGGAHEGASVQVIVACATAGATIHFTVDDTEPTTSSASVASGSAVSVPLPGTLRARGWKAGMTPSPERIARYVVSGDPLLLEPTQRLHAAPASAAPHTVQVTGPGAWTADAGAQPWITLVSGQDGNGSGAITYTVEPNPDPSRRVGQIDVQDASGTETFTVTQLGAGALAPWGGNHAGQLDVPPDPGPFQAISAGSAHYLALRTNGTVLAWGSGTTVPSHVSNVVAVAAGDAFSLALHANGTVSAWGYDGEGRLDVPPGLSNVVAVSAGMGHSLALRADGTVVGWGQNDYGESTIPVGVSNVTAVAAGGDHSVVLLSNGTVVVWGDEWFGQTAVPPGLSNVVAIAAGGWHSLALKSDGTVAAWGDHWSGEIDIPEGLDQVAGIAAGSSFSMALRTNGMIVAWGADWAGQTDLPVDLPPARAIAADGGGIALLSWAPPTEPTTPNGIALSWLEEHELPTDGTADLLDPYDKRMTLVDQYIADTNPHDPDDVFQIEQVGTGDGCAIHFRSSTRRLYTLLGGLNGVEGEWLGIPGCGPRSGVGGSDVMCDTNPVPAAIFYRLKVALPAP